jgi:hypothetical protein
LGLNVSITLDLDVCERDGARVRVSAPIDRVLLLGYTGRDRAVVLEHIRELEALGVPPPDRVPALYVVPPDLVTHAARLQVRSAQTSGEAEFFVLDSPAGVLVGVGSDHTDRGHERIDIAASKALCGKVIGPQVWRLADVDDHWDRLELRAWSTDGGGRRVYQSGQLGALLTVSAMVAEVEGAGFRRQRSLIFSGTLPTQGGLAYGSRFEVELRDPVLDRSLSRGYEIDLIT